jgi:hypothetical protein
MVFLCTDILLIFAVTHLKIVVPSVLLLRISEKQTHFLRLGKLYPMFLVSRSKYSG